MTSGGVVPCGMDLTATCAIAVICAIAISTLTFGWKNTFTSPTPFNDCVSVCSTSLTVVVSERSKPVTMRLFMSSAGRPVYCQTTDTTGMLILGKMSVGVRRTASGPRISNNSAKTIKVSGRSSAILTIHIGVVFHRSRTRQTAPYAERDLL